MDFQKSNKFKVEFYACKQFNYNENVNIDCDWIRMQEIRKNLQRKLGVTKTVKSSFRDKVDDFNFDKYIDFL